MKKIILLIIFSLVLNKLIAQSVSYLSYKYTEVLSISIKYTYYGNSYSHYEPYISTGNILATLQARYDRNADITVSYTHLTLPTTPYV